MIPEHFPDAVLHEHVVMPNHIHGIIELRKNPVGTIGLEYFQPLQSMNDLVTKVGVQNLNPKTKFTKPGERKIDSQIVNNVTYSIFHSL
jgi:hypothetical protein